MLDNFVKKMIYNFNTLVKSLRKWSNWIILTKLIYYVLLTIMLYLFSQDKIFKTIMDHLDGYLYRENKNNQRLQNHQNPQKLQNHLRLPKHQKNLRQRNSFHFLLQKANKSQKHLKKFKRKKNNQRKNKNNNKKRVSLNKKKIIPINQ